MSTVSSVSTVSVPAPVVSRTAASVPDAAPASAATPSAPAPETPYSKNRDRYKELINIIVNDSGTYSLDDQMKAFAEHWGIGVSGGLLVGDDPSTKDQYDEVTALVDKVHNSTLSRRMDQVYNNVVNDDIAADLRGEPTAISGLRYFSSLSEDDQKLYYTSQNGFDMSGNRQYANFDSFRNQLVENAQAQAAYIAKNPQAQAAYKNTDPGLAEALKTIESARAGSGWSAQILSLFNVIGTSNPEPEPGRMRLTLDVKPSVPGAYNPGNLLDRVA